MSFSCFLYTFKFVKYHVYSQYELGNHSWTDFNFCRDGAHIMGGVTSEQDTGKRRQPGHQRKLRKTVSIDEIQSCEMLEKMPEITLRTNGIGLPNVRIGHFRVSGIGKCRLYINLKYPPFVHVTTVSGKHIFFNTKDPEVTAGLFEAISDSIKPAQHE